MKHSRALLTFAFSVALAGAGTTPVVPITASTERTTVVTLADGNTIEKTSTGKYYRDSLNRVRREEGPFVTISDPVARSTVILDTRTKVGRRVSVTSPNPASPFATAKGNPPETMDLGERTIGGVKTRGKQHVNVIPANGKLGNKHPIEQKTQLWFSDALQLPVLTVVSSPISETRVRLKVASRDEPDPALFVVPQDYKVVDVIPAAR